MTVLMVPSKKSKVYIERKLYAPYEMPSPRTEESIRKIWNYIKQETRKSCSAVEHVVNNPISGASVISMVSRALEKFKATHKKGFHMVHCWDKRKSTQKWQTSFAAYDEAVKNVTTPVVVDDEDDDHGRQALLPRPRGHKATKTDLAWEAAVLAFTQSLEKLMTENRATMAKRDENKRLEKEAATAIYLNLTKEVIEKSTPGEFPLSNNQDPTQIVTAVMRCSGGDGGVDGGDDDDDDDGDDVQLDDDGDGDGVDFPLREGISPADSCPPESSLLSGVLRPAEAAVTLRDVPYVA
ncbi:hypothetical protein QYE76_048929 [Lolium multiflorum]|uniref:Uncharacterized protein n=1 Tax=Lolium multiflorum TaxID=4521 RepID=A0AAD8SMU9_LOLMU|nr:hypothetical protein QYE76_048929 [Lolium multiflorum]